VKSSADVDGLANPTAKFHIISYGLFSRASPVRDLLRENSPFKFVVVDESHMIKCRTSLRTKELLQIIKQATRVLLLSGTPALARPLELYTQIEAVEPGLFKSFSAFTSRYCAPKWTPFGMDFNGASNLDELHGILRPIMVRRLKAEVLSELPSKRRQRIQLDVDRTAVSACTSLREELQTVDADDRLHRQRLLTEMYKETSVAKEGAASEYIENLMLGGCKFLVFGHHLAMLDALQAAAVKNQVKFIRIDGSVSSAERLRRVTEFQTDDTVRVAILGLMAAGVGITLTAASTVVFAELHWTPGVLVQAEDRAHRIGQKASVNIHYLVAPGTIDDIIWSSVSHKVEVVSKMCDGQQDHLVAGYSSAGNAVEAATEAAKQGQASDIMDLLSAVETTPRQKHAAAAKENATAVESPQSAEKTTKLPTPAAFSVLSMLKGEAPPRAKSKVINVDDDVIESASETELVGDGIKTAESSSLSFCVTKATGRVHVLDAHGQPTLGCNFKMAEWEAQRDVEAVCSEALNGDAKNVQITEAFLRQWEALKPSEQRQMLDQVVRLPLAARPQKKTRKSSAKK
jgi:hypothetical protein